MDLGPECEHIPRDADGVPIFFILPPGIRASYAKKMWLCEQGWQATGDPLLVAEAVTLTTAHRQPIPAWLDEAVFAVAVKRRTDAQKKAARDAQIHFERFLAVRHAHERDGLTWEDSYKGASEVLKDSPAAGSVETCRQSYLRVNADTDAGLGALYVLPKEQNRKPPITEAQRKAEHEEQRRTRKARTRSRLTRRSKRPT